MNNRIEDMEKTIQTIKGDNTQLMKENRDLKYKISGYKTSNDNYRKQVADLKNQLKTQNDIAEDGIDRLRAVINSLKLQVSQLRASISEKDALISDLEEVIEEASKPWWKKLF